MKAIFRLLPITELNKCLSIDWKSLRNNQEEMVSPLGTEAQTALIFIMPFNSTDISWAPTIWQLHS